jgi:hypothetical protein
MIDRNRPEDAPIRPATAKMKSKSEIVRDLKHWSCRSNYVGNGSKRMTKPAIA